MPTPSFDELLARARQIGEAEADSRRPSTGMLAAKGASEFVNTLLNTKVSDQRTVGGYLKSDGNYQALDRPYTTGGTFLQTLAQRFRNPEGATGVPSGAYALTPDQTGEFAMKSALEKQKAGTTLEVANIRAKAMIEAAMKRGGRASGVLSSNVPDIVRDAVYDEMERRMGTTIAPENRTPLNLAHLREFRQEGYIGDEFTRKMIPILKDRILGLPEDVVSKVFDMQSDVNENRFPKRKLFSQKMTEFSNDDAALQAFRAGKVKKGDTVMIKGEEVVLQ